MNFKKGVKDFWKYLKKDTWDSWLVSLVLAFLLIKFVFFPGLSFALQTDLPLVVVESCSMYHDVGFEEWWESNGAYYESIGITKTDFKDFSFRNGMNKGDIILVTGHGGYKAGDVIIFESSFKYPLIHRLINEDPYGTKGDNNAGQLPQEGNIPEESVLGKSVLRIPGLGWVKLIFFEGLKPEGQRGFCK